MQSNVGALTQHWPEMQREHGHSFHDLSHIGNSSNDCSFAAGLPGAASNQSKLTLPGWS